MAKLSFRYGAMNSGKTTTLMQVAYNYEERNQKVIVIKPIVDTKGGNQIVSRIGLKRNVDILLKETDNVLDYIKQFIDEKIDVILIDEAQFLKKHHVHNLWIIAKIYDIPVLCYGIRNNYKASAFEGSAALWELADEFIEIPTICYCGKKARFNPRKINGDYDKDNREIIIDGEDNVEYISLCGKCYIKEVLEYKREKL